MTARTRPERLAGRFAVKEAVMKAHRDGEIAGDPLE